MLPVEKRKEVVRNDISSAQGSTDDMINKSHGTVGQPSLGSKFPALFPDFIKQNSFSAQFRRPTDTGTSSGLTIAQIQEHAKNAIPGFRKHGMHLTTIRRLFEAPNNSISFQRITLIFSIDMAKLKVGPPAVSRYHQLRRIYSSNDMPNLPDHYFSVPSYLLSTSGYLRLELKVPTIEECIIVL